MPSTEAPVEVNRKFSPDYLAQKEFEEVFHDIKGQHTLAFESHVLSVQHQFALSREAAEAVVRETRPDENKPADLSCQADYFSTLVDELGFSERSRLLVVGLVGLVGHQSAELDLVSTVCLWAIIYGVDPKKMEPVWKQRIATFEKLQQSPKNPDWVRLRDGLKTYYEGLKAVIPQNQPLFNFQGAG